MKKQGSTSLKVNTGVVRRTVKELEMYKQEVEDGQKALEKLSPDDDFYSQTARALDESKTMVVNTIDRLKSAAADLDSKLSGASGEDQEVEEAKLWAQNAKEALAAN